MIFKVAIKLQNNAQVFHAEVEAPCEEQAIREVFALRFIKCSHSVYINLKFLEQVKVNG
jgi:hypothetical protein